MIYLDNAATTFPKPPAVRREVERCLREYCGNPGRSAHKLSLAAAEAVYDCRLASAELFGISSPERIIFTYNTTYALNMAIKGLLHRGDHVLISDMEHNAVFRPVHRLAALGEISYDIFPTGCADPPGSAEDILLALRKLLRHNTRMLITAHIPNLCSAVMPLEVLGRFCRENKLLFVVDAAQSAGIEHIDCEKMQIDALCVPGHKGLYGPQGSGILALGSDLTMATLIEGGSGIHSLDPAMPEFPPERYEAGTLATPTLAGLCAGIKFVMERGLDRIRKQEQMLYLRLREQLLNTDGITVYAPNHVGSTLLFNLEGIPSADAAAMLDRHDIYLRAGFHCAPLGHKTLGTGENGALRAGFSVFNQASDVDALVRSLRQIRREHGKT
ncbi:MAG: aminotransferase class V-fold PLP-dependent enzyme [Ruminococcaceae bacterium]|nr:aminotransferase class V-fold PLP-dependent enzyme [Oscillospiraceae bacterium]